jgi:hypothetical protein
LAIPFAHLLLTSFFHSQLENKITGIYTFGKEQEILKINENGTFDLKKSPVYINSGTGTWEIQEIDFPILILNFKSHANDSWFEIKIDGESIILSPTSMSDDIPFDLIQTKTGTASNTR